MIRIVKAGTPTDSAETLILGGGLLLDQDAEGLPILTVDADFGGIGVSALDDLDDVIMAGVADNELLQYDALQNAFVNVTLAEAGIAELGHVHAWGDITSGKPTTLAGYGITDAAPLSHVHAAADVTSGTFADARIPNLAASKITSGVFAVARGGTGLSTYTGAGRLIYSTAAATLAALAPGSDGQVLTLAAGLPAWAAPGAPGAHTHAAADITSGTFADARISASSVTQHQGALSIAWGQITATPTTLAGYGITDAAPLVHTHGWADVSKTGSSLADLATRSAAALNSGTLAEARLPATVVLTTGAQTISGVKTFSASNIFSAAQWLAPTADTGQSAINFATAVDRSTYWHAVARGSAHAASNDWLLMFFDGAAFNIALTVDGPTRVADFTQTPTAAGETIATRTWVQSQGYLTAIGSHTHPWSDITATPTTRAGYGITDAAAAVHVHAAGDITTGVLAVARGGTGLGTYTGAGRLIYSTGAAVLAALAPGTDGHVLTLVAGLPAWTAAGTPGAHVHAAADITSGTFADARIGASNVTQHAAALSIAWGQLTGVPATFTPSAHVHSAADITTGTLAVARGGTGLATYTGAGRIIYSSAATTLAALAPGTNGHVLTLVAGLPAWAAPAAPSAHVHAAADITSGTFADARVAASNVTQHAAALSIGWAQLTGVPATFTPSAHVHAWADITSGKPTTLAGYGITDGLTQAAGDVRYAQLASVNAFGAGSELRILSASDGLKFGGIAATDVAIGHNVLTYRPNSGASAGAIVIETTIPASSNTMAVAKIGIQIHSGTTAGYTEVRARWYRTGAAWTAASVLVVGPWRVDVQLGTNAAGNVVIILGTVGQSLSWPHVVVEEAQLAHATLAWSYLSGWTVSRPTVDLTAYSNLTTPASSTSISYSTLADVPATFAPSAHVHAAADTTSGTFADGRISASSVTQHQAALSIAWGQLTAVPGTFAPSAHTHPFSEVTGTIAAGQIAAATITSAMLRNSAAVSVIGRSAGTVGVPGDIVAGAVGHVLRRDATNGLVFGTLEAAAFADNTITSARISGAILVAKGGTGRTSLAAGRLLVGTGAELNDLAPGGAGTVLTIVGGTPAWAAPSVPAHTHTAADITSGVLDLSRVHRVAITRDDNVTIAPNDFPTSAHWRFAIPADAGNPPGATAWVTALLTVQGWAGHNLSYPTHQLSFRGGVLGMRASTGAATWGAWETLATQSWVTSSHTHTASQITAGTFAGTNYKIASAGANDVSLSIDKGASGAYGYLAFHTAGALRFMMANDITSDNWTLYRYDNAGGYLGGMTYERTTGKLKIDGGAFPGSSYGANLGESANRWNTVWAAQYSIDGQATIEKAVSGGALIYGSFAVVGSSNAYAGIQFFSANRTLMVSTDGTIQGFYKYGTSAAWDWYFNAGVLTVGTVPPARITPGTFGGSGTYTFPGSIVLPQGSVVYLDGGGDTFVYSSASNVMILQTGGVAALTITATSISSPATITAAGFYESSSRELKTKIADWKRDALELLRQVRIREFAYRAEPAEMRVGIIAEEADSIFSGRDRRHFNVADTLAVVMRGMQQLDARLAALEA